MAEGDNVVLPVDLAARARAWAEAEGVTLNEAVAEAVEALIDPYRNLVWDEGGPPSAESDRAAFEAGEREGWISGEEFLAEVRAMGERFEARLRAKT